MSNTVTFVSRYPGFEQILDPDDVIVDAKGRTIRPAPGTHIRFEGGRADITETPDGRALVNGKPVQMPFKEIIERMEHLPANGARFQREKALEEKHPTVDEVTALIEKAADAKEIQGMLTAEQETHNRPEVVQLLTSAAIDRAVKGAQNEAKVKAKPSSPVKSKKDHTGPSAVDESEPPQDSAIEPPGADESGSGGDDGKPD